MVAEEGKESGNEAVGGVVTKVSFVVGGGEGETCLEAVFLRLWGGSWTTRLPPMTSSLRGSLWELKGREQIGKLRL